MAGCKPQEQAATTAAAVAGGYDYNGNVVIDPVNRIEGHLRVVCEVENGKVKDVWSQSVLFRGIEIILQGRDPRDAPHFTQRSCGVCTHVHALASTRALDDAFGVQGKIPENGVILRNLIMGSQFLHDHLVHFYHLHALDWVDVVSALSADPKKAADIANSISPRETKVSDLKAVQDRVKKLVDSGQLGIFTNAYFLEPHDAYRLPPEVNLIATAHYLEALKVQILPSRMMAIIGGKNPHTQSLLAGGISCYDALRKERIAELRSLFNQTKKFIQEVYLTDLLAVAPYYLDWGGIGGTTNFMSFGEFPEDETDLNSRYIPQGVIYNRDMSKVEDFNPDMIEEHVKRSWYEAGSPKHPYKGETKPMFTDMDDLDGKYSWMKAPRYGDASVETGPLATVLVAYAKGQPQAKAYVDTVLKKLGVGPEALFSTLGRTAARCVETLMVIDKMDEWFNRLEANVAKGNTDIVFDAEIPKSGQGVGFVNAPRGGLSHWIDIEDHKIKNFQLVVPSTWNLGPRCDNGKMSAVEEALVGTPVFDPKRPVEILRTIHSYDPCIACGVHVIDPKSNEVYKFKVC
jgi:[NiFe] hydrogenase large subunit